MSDKEVSSLPEFSAEAVRDGYWELYHDDDCGETLIASPSGRENSYCPKCKFSPDMQSLGARRTQKLGASEPSAQYRGLETSSGTVQWTEVEGYVRGDAPEFAELKEFAKLRMLAQMATDAPCFTNAILAVTDAYREGWADAKGSAKWKCLARSANMGANDPQECDWPVCGCDPYADKVIAALQEHGIIGDSAKQASGADQSKESVSCKEFAEELCSIVMPVLLKMSKEEREERLKKLNLKLGEASNHPHACNDCGKLVGDHVHWCKCPICLPRHHEFVGAEAPQKPSTDERAKFEKYASQKFISLKYDPKEEYADPAVQDAWDAWEYRARLREAEHPEPSKEKP